MKPQEMQTKQKTSRAWLKTLHSERIEAAEIRAAIDAEIQAEAQIDAVHQAFFDEFDRYPFEH